ncbi:hypothetical protein AMJ52_02610 [candidate division TA06 bacterium DG_78]|uniref:TIR domain-containing protein n=1 Tax=candidate division TA06 bacterium DG_78 TaxID=1703772 RepID=A0A0S7YHT3_UNCT6|nr:MAG: hypothetical protein AMJ52_02610 [candidate division TA06 bacterium DG_78]
MKVFISYTHDGKEYADTLERDLRAQDIDIWIDKRCIRPGHIWLREIDDALSQVDYVLGVLTENYLTSVGGDEAYAIISKGLKEKKVRFISLFFVPPHEVKSVIIPALQGFNFSKDYTQGFSSFLDFLKQEGGKKLVIEKEIILPKETVPAEGKTSISHNLPPQLTPFVGRKDEMAEIEKRLEDPSCRLLTLVGPGGIGKTRLAIKVASEKIGTFAHGVYFVPLAPLPSSDLLVSTCADFLGFSFYGQEDPKMQLINYLHEKEILILMDNFEHLLDGTEFLAEILAAAPKIKIIVTSRERLNLKGEWVVEIHGLRFPKSDEDDKVEGYDAVQLFVQSAQRVCPGFVLSENERAFAIRICQLVDGLPLAIELASSWTRVLSCKEIFGEIEHNIDFLATSMRDVPERHRSLRAVFEQSWNFLTGEEKNVFKKMFVFRGGFQREAVEKIAGASLDLLYSLVDKSFLHWNPLGRYEIHGYLRQYAEEKLSEFPKEKEKIRNLHCDYYVQFLCQREKYMKGQKQKEALEEISEEIENVRAAWNRVVDQKKKKDIEKCIESLYCFYDIRSWFKEGEEIFRKLVMRLQGEKKDILYGKILARQGCFLYRLGLYKKAKDILQKSFSILHDFRDQREIAFSLNTLGVINYYLGEYREAKQLHEESLEMRREIDDQLGIANSLNALGNVALKQGLYAEAKKLHHESLKIRREIGDRRRIANSLNNLAIVAYSQGELAEAKKLFRESIAVEKIIDDKWGIAGSLNNLGTIAYCQKEYREAKKLLEESLAIYKEIGHQWGIGNTFNSLGYVAYAQTEYKAAQGYFDHALGIATEVQLIPLALDVLVGVATLFAQGEKKDKSVELLALVLQHSASDKETKDDAERLLGELKAEFRARVFTKIQKRGRSRKVEEVVREILQDKK